MKGYAFHAHLLAASPPNYIGVCLAPLKTTCYMKECENGGNIDKKILILLEKLKQMAGVEKNFRINFQGFLSLPSCYASLARIFYNFFNVEKENILKCLLEIDVKSAISFVGGFSFIGKDIQKIFTEKIGMLMVKEEGKEKPSPYVEEMKKAILTGDAEKMGMICERGIDIPTTMKKLWDTIHELREKGMPCYLSLGIFPLVITYPEIIGEIINVLQVKNFDVDIVFPGD
ncbi:MAG: hypothetical protein FE048_02300 [Thermoplasmata archaeon]|nr:MAG: hypothetical protein FE048_02300 [Thermoplasmata archaeon]